MKTFRSWYIQLSPKTRQTIVIVLAASVLITVIAIFQGENPNKREVYNKKADQVVNVLTDTSNRNVGLDNMAGQIRRLNQQNEKLLKEVDSLRRAQNAAREENQQDQLARQLEQLNAKLQALEQERIDAREIAQTTTEVKSEGKTTKSKDAVPEPEQRVTPISQNPFAQQPTQVASQKQGRTAPLRINVVSEAPEIDEPKQEKQEPKDGVAYIPAGTILTGTIITGADFPTSKGGFENPTPTLIRLQKEAILPNRYRSDVRECFLLVGGRGELSSERAKLRGEMLSCVRNDGAVIETKLNSYVAGEDGKEGVKGRLVSKQGQMIARSLVAGFASGMSEAFDYDPVPVIATDASNSTQYQKNFSSDAVKGGFAKGASTALERVADFYMDLAEEMFPVVEINAGRQVDIVVITGTRLSVTAESVDGSVRK